VQRDGCTKEMQAMRRDIAQLQATIAALLAATTGTLKNQQLRMYYRSGTGERCRCIIIIIIIIFCPAESAVKNNNTE